MTANENPVGAGAGSPGWHVPTHEELVAAAAKLPTIDPNALPPWAQKLLALLIGILTGVGGSLKESGTFDKTQQATILGTSYTLTEKLNGSVEFEAVPN